MTNSPTEHGERVSAGELAFWDFAAGSPVSFVMEEGASSQVYDLEERTARFGEQVILFAKKIPWSPVNNRLIDQLVGAGTSVGANYCEADDAASRADFKHRISICRKEARETKHFLRMVATAEPSLRSDARTIWKEAHELHLIFCRIWRSTIV
jgi:four helix bundle protein